MSTGTVQYRDPTPEEGIELFKALEAKFPSKTLGDDKWYLVATSALAGAEPTFVANLYSYLISKPQFSTPSSRQALIRRIREVLVKDVAIMGVCKPMAAIIAIRDVEREEDKDYSFTREHWKSGEENHVKGVRWLDTVYERNMDSTLGLFDAHKDFAWISTDITYGLYLSDQSILGPIETQIVVVSAVMIQNLPMATGWHLRGTRRVGLTPEDVESVQQCVEMIAKFAGVRLDRVPRVTAIEHEV